MGIFKQFEEQVLDLLTSSVLASEVLESVKREGVLDRYDYTGSGYLLSVKHPRLPRNRIVCRTPVVMGSAGGIDSGFVVFIEKGTLTLECHSWGEFDVPQNYRDLNVQISA